MNEPKPLQISYNAFTDVLTVDGMGYAGALFRALGGPLPIGQWFQVISRDDGVITVSRLGSTMEDEIKRLQTELHSAECVVRQAAEDTFGKEMTVKEFAEASSYDS